jgi:FtsP/CotA-like multicopper oxidase with cupredoxin domain
MRSLFGVVTTAEQRTAQAALPVEPGGRRLGGPRRVSDRRRNVVKIAIRFDVPGRYVYHCHVLEHEDTELMLPSSSPSPA